MTYFRVIFDAKSDSDISTALKMPVLFIIAILMCRRRRVVAFNDFIILPELWHVVTYSMVVFGAESDSNISTALNFPFLPIIYV